MDTICPEILCRECRSEAELIVDRTAEGKIVRVGGHIFCMKPVERSQFCYYHNKKRRGRFSAEWKPGSGLFNITRASGSQNYTRK